MKVLKEQIKQMHQRYIAIKTLKSGGSISDAVSVSGLREVDVIALKKGIRKKQDNEKDKEI